MADNKVQHTPSPLAEYFTLSYEIAESLGAKLHRGLNLSNDRPVSLWISKQPIDLNSFDAHLALKHLHAVGELEPALSCSDQYGIDAEGYSFLVFTENVQANISSQRGTLAEMIRRFFKTLRLVQRAHQTGIVFGDLNKNSFWLNNQSEIELTGGCKLTAKNLPQLIGNAPEDVLLFAAPEVLAGSSAAKESDVYSLGVIGFHLLCNQMPIEFDVKSGEVRQNNNFAPSHGLSSDILEVLYTAISFDPQERFISASEFVDAMIEAYESQAAVSADTGKKKFSQSTADGGINSLPAIRRVKKLQNEPEENQNLAEQLVNRGYKLVLYAVGFCVVVATLAGVYFYKQYQEQLAEQVTLATDPFTGGNPELKSAVSQISNLTADDQTKIAELEKLYVSSDPLAYNLLIAGLRSTENPDVRKAALEGIISRLKKANLQLSAQQLQQWLRYSGKKPEDKIYTAILKALDPVTPADGQIKLLTELSQEDLNMATRLTAALYFDKNQASAYKPLLVNQIVKPENLATAGKLSGSAVILLNESLAKIFKDQIIDNLDKLSAADINEILPKIVESDSFAKDDLLKIAANNPDLDPAKKLILKVVSEPNNLSAKQISSLVNVAMGDTDQDDLTEIFSWREQQSEKILLTILTVLDSAEKRKLVLDNLSIRNLKIDLASGLLRWLRENDWQHRADYALDFGILANSEAFSQEKLASALRRFGKNIGDDTLQQALLASDDDRLLNLLIKDYSRDLSLLQKVKMLKHESSFVREGVISKIKTNDVGAMKLITEAYNKESSERIKNLYRKQFWFIKK